jgi:hypothetical protein
MIRQPILRLTMRVSLSAFCHPADIIASVKLLKAGYGLRVMKWYTEQSGWSADYLA